MLSGAGASLGYAKINRDSGLLIYSKVMQRQATVFCRKNDLPLDDLVALFT